MNRSYDDNNVFAKILRHEINCSKVLENEFALSFMDINPQAKIHILVIPKNKYVDFYDFNSAAESREKINFWKLVNELIDKYDISNNGFRLITTSGKDGNQDVPHFHVHLLGGQNLGRMIN